MIYTIGSSRNSFLPLDDFRKQFIVDREHPGDNIDHLNRHYCELTGLYYMWKHETDDLCGLEHYRRYFYDDNHLLSRAGAAYFLEHSDIILIPHHHPMNRTTYQWFIGAMKAEDIEKWVIALDTIHPEFTRTFTDYLNSNLVYICNMFVTRKEVLDAWCSWLFPALHLYDEAAGLGEHNRRIDGYLAEHTLGAWCIFNKMMVANGTLHMT